MHHAAPYNPESFDWAEPLICEQVIQTYARPGRTGRPYDHMACLQTKMWLSLIDGDKHSFTARRDELYRLAGNATVSVLDMHRADKAVIAELVAVVRLRHKRMARVRHACLERLQCALQVIKEMYDGPLN